MNRRVSKSAAAILALTLALSAPSAFAAARTPRFDDPASPIERVIRAVKKFVKGFIPATHEEIITPSPPKP